MNNIGYYLNGKKKVAIAGHVTPDGDCIGSCMGLWIYLQDNYPEIEADVYMAKVSPIYDFIYGIDKIHDYCSEGDQKKYDLMIALDISSYDRIGVARGIFDEVPEVLCIDHHKTNNGTYTYFYNDPDASSTCEALYRHLEYEKISKQCAEVLYMGIVHDTGVFRYSSTSPETMRVAAKLMEKGIDVAKIIDETFYQKTYAQQRLQGYVMVNSSLYLDGKFIVGRITREDRKKIGVKTNEIEGIVSVLRDTIGVEVSMLMHELDTGEIKISMRSKALVDVSKICMQFGGGGHVRASGCKISGKSMDDITEEIIPMIREQLEA